MAFDDPQILDALGDSLPRVSVGDNKSVYQNDDGSTKVTISHSYGKRTRRVIRLDHEVLVENPLIDGLSTRETFSTYQVLDAPSRGIDNSVLRDALLDISVQFSNNAEGDARAAKFLGGQS